MSVYKQIGQDARLASRRFGKSIVCRIVHGPLLSFIESKGLVPQGIYINNSTGMDPINGKMLVIPITKYDEIINSFILSNTVTSNQVDLDFYETEVKKNDYLVSLIKQNLVLVTINHSKPAGAEGGANPEVYDIIIDSIDVNQVIEGTYVHRNSREAIRQEEKWNRK